MKYKIAVISLTLSAIILGIFSIVLMNMAVIDNHHIKLDTVEDEQTACKITKIVLENKFEQKFDIEKFSARLDIADEKDILDDYWEITYVDENTQTSVIMLKGNAEIIDIIYE